MNKAKIINEINEKYPFLIHSIESATPIEEMLDFIENQQFPENSDFQGFFVAYFTDKGYKLIHNSRVININHAKDFESITEKILENIDEYNISSDLLQMELDDVYLMFKVYFDPTIKDKLLAIGHILKKNINTRLMILDQKQNNKLIKD